MGVLSAYAFSFMSKYLHQSCGPKPMTRVDINDNNQSSNTQDLVNLWDISIWSDDEDKTWIRWEVNNRPQELDGEWNKRYP
jgi:hypothetical protein